MQERRANFTFSESFKIFRDGKVGGVVVDGLHGSLGPFRNSTESMRTFPGKQMDGEFRAGFNAGRW